MNSKWLNYFKEKEGMPENQVFNGFFGSKPSDYDVLNGYEKTELNNWIDEQRKDDEHN